MLQHMTATEYIAWQAYEQRTGVLGQERDDILAALVAERVTTMLTAKQKSKRAKKWEISDFIPKWGSQKKTSTQRAAPEEMKKKLLDLNKAFGGTERRG